jgi:hypothetical protein
MQNNVTLNKKSGKGTNDGVISEMTLFFGVRPGHEEELRAAVARFAEVVRKSDPQATQKTGLRDSRHAIFDNGQRLLWATTFETDWDPYLDDALILVGVEHFIDWMQHIVEAEQLVSWLQSAGGAEKLTQASTAEFEQTVRTTSAGLKAILQSVQVPAAGYWNALAAKTIPEIRKAERVEQAFQQALDHPEAAQALSHPALQPLLEQAAD